MLTTQPVILSDALRNPDAYPHPVPDEVEFFQTHISRVFVAGDRAYKIKRPVPLPFLDYGTLERRRHFCEQELELNRRLAPAVYLGLAAVTAGPDDTYRFTPIENLEADEEIHEWAVVMRRLNPEDNLRARLRRDDVPTGFFTRLGHRLARFHRDARRGPEISEPARFDTVHRLAMDNFAVAPHFDELASDLEAELLRLKPLIEARARDHIPCDCHGDLRLEHVYHSHQEGLEIVDCIEFNDELRYSDPASDLAFLLMDLEVRNYRDESRRLLRAYRDASEHSVPWSLLRLYRVYRSCVRGKVHTLMASDQAATSERKAHSERKARGHFQYAVDTLAEPGEILLVAGLPATGKSTLARELRARGDVEVVLDSDVVRKELAGLAPTSSARADLNAGIYTPEFSDRTYQELRRRAQEALTQGHSVAIAATFVKAHRRAEFLEMASEIGAPIRFLECRIPRDLAMERIKARTDDPSDATAEVYDTLATAWEPLSPQLRQIHEVISTS